MGRTSTPIVIHRLSISEQRVLSSFLSGRLPAGQVHAELERARTEPALAQVTAPEPAPVVQPVSVVAA
jgi:hypothetical protein